MGDEGMGTPSQRSLGLRWSMPDDDPATVHVDMGVRDDLRGPAGSVEGGVLSTLVDVAGASAAARAVGPLVATQSLTISFLAPGRVGPLRATGLLLRKGEHDAVSQVRIVDVGSDDRLLCVGLVTVRVLHARG